jgi:hypothetical protein
MRIRIEFGRHSRDRGAGRSGSRLRRVLATLVVLGLVGTVTSVGSYSAFTATTSSTGNSFAAGSVSIEDDDAASAMLSLSNAKPGDSDTSCIKVRYTGSLGATVRLFASTTGTLPQYLNVTVTRGANAAPSFDSCASFAPDPTNYIGAGAGVIYDGTLSAMPTSYAAAIVDPTSGSPASWNTNDEHSYRFVVTLADDNSAQTLSGSASFTWEARNQ